MTMPPYGGRLTENFTGGWAASDQCAELVRVNQRRGAARAPPPSFHSQVLVSMPLTKRASPRSCRVFRFWPAPTAARRPGNMRSGKAAYPSIRACFARYATDQRRQRSGDDVSAVIGRNWLRRIDHAGRREQSPTDGCGYIDCYGVADGSHHGRACSRERIPVTEGLDLG